jgi:hypothetical protein
MNHELVLRGTIAYLNYYTNEAIESEDIEQKKSIILTQYEVKGDREAIDRSMLEKIKQSEEQMVPKETEWIKQEMGSWKHDVYTKIKASRKMFR